jgi:hypothetical protein
VLCLCLEISEWRYVLDAVSAQEKWTPTTRDEMDAFFGINVYRGVVVINDTASYWAEDTAVPFVQKTMSRNRFVRLNAGWHLVDPDADAEHKGEAKRGDSWSKLRPLLDPLLAACRAHYHPHQHLSVDEQIIAAQHRHTAVQLMPAKPARWGFKNFVICDAESSYVLGFDLYRGMVDGKSETGLTTNIVMNLAEPWFSLGHIIVTDNFFSSMAVVQRLQRAGTGFIGTLKRGRTGLPDGFFIEKKALKRGEHRIYQQGNITATAWGDRNVVFLLSSVHSPMAMGTVKRRIAGYRQVDVPAPMVVVDYQQYMRGVDRVDQQCSTFSPGSQSHRWWVPIAWWLVNLACHNAYIIHSELRAASGARPMENNAFRVQLAKQLINNWSGRKRSGRPAAAPSSADHRLVHSDVTRDCAICSSRAPGGTRAQTHYLCNPCHTRVCVGCYDAHRAV